MLTDFGGVESGFDKKRATNDDIKCKKRRQCKSSIGNHCRKKFNQNINTFGILFTNKNVRNRHRNSLNHIKYIIVFPIKFQQFLNALIF